MPYYGLSFSQYIDHGNGTRLCRLLKIIQSDHADIETAQAALDAELKKFVDLYNDYNMGYGWKPQQDELDKLISERKAAIRDFKEDVSYLNERDAAKLKEDHEEFLAVSQLTISSLEGEIEQIRADLHKKLYWPEQAHDAGDEDEEDDYWSRKERKAKKLDFPEWARIPGFGNLTYDTIFGGISQRGFKEKVDLESAKIIPLDDALAVLARQYPITY